MKEWEKGTTAVGKEGRIMTRRKWRAFEYEEKEGRDRS